MVWLPSLGKLVIVGSWEAVVVQMLVVGVDEVCRSLLPARGFDICLRLHLKCQSVFGAACELPLQ